MFVYRCVYARISDLPVMVKVRLNVKLYPSSTVTQVFWLLEPRFIHDRNGGHRVLILTNSLITTDVLVYLIVFDLIVAIQALLAASYY